MSECGKWPNVVERSGDGYRLMQADSAWQVWQAATRKDAQWLPISTAPRDGTVIDLWVNEVRLTDYRWHQLTPDNGFFDPVYGGPLCVRTATHWMPIPSAPEKAPLKPARIARSARAPRWVTTPMQWSGSKMGQSRVATASSGWIASCTRSRARDARATRHFCAASRAIRSPI